MHNPFSSFPSVDHLVEGVHYHVVDWDFADAAPACPEGEKMVFGMCRKLGGSGEKDFDSGKKSSQEEGAEAEAKKQGSEFKNNKQVTVNGKKMGWAMKGGKPVMVEWGSVAGEKKVGPKTPAISKSPSPKRVAPAPATNSQTAAAALVSPSSSSRNRQDAINEIGRETLRV